MTLSQSGAVGTGDPLASWNDGPTKKSIVDFVARVTKADSIDYVAPEERIATFDNDGTLWSEQPYYFQFAFALDRVKAMAPQHPEWQSKEPFKSILAHDIEGVFAGGEHSLVEIVAATHFGLTTDEFETLVHNWLATGASSENQQTVHRNGVPADAGIAHLSPGQWLQDLHRLGGRH